MEKPAAVLALAVALLGIASTLPAQGTRQLVPANLLIPQPPPFAPLSDWVDSAAHSKVSLPLTAGAELRGWDYKPATETDPPVILFFNGNGMTVDRSDSLYRSLERLGAEVVAYDYRGIGFSSGQPDVLTFRQDSLHAYDAVVAAHPGRRVVVFGFSLGTAMASYVASQRPLAGLILAGTIASAIDEFPVYMRAAGVDPSLTANLQPGDDAIEAFNEVANVAKSKAPLLMLHGEADILVPITQGRKVFSASPSSEKQFVALPGISHNGTAGAAQSLRAVGDFLHRISG